MTVQRSDDALVAVSDDLLHERRRLKLCCGVWYKHSSGIPFFRSMLSLSWSSAWVHGFGNDVNHFLHLES